MSISTSGMTIRDVVEAVSRRSYVNLMPFSMALWLREPNYMETNARMHLNGWKRRPVSLLPRT